MFKIVKDLIKLLENICLYLTASSCLRANSFFFSFVTVSIFVRSDPNKLKTKSVINKS